MDAIEAATAYDAQRGAVDLLVADLMLPGESGRAFAGRLKRENAGLRILFISGYAEQLELHEAGIEECLAKPFSVGVLLRKVKQVLDRGAFQIDEQGVIKNACLSA